MKRTLVIVAGIAAAIVVVVAMAVRLGHDPSPLSSSAADERSFASSDPLASSVPASGDAVRIAMADFVPLHADSRVLVVDVRVDDAFREGHIPGAIHVESESVAGRASEILTLAAGRPIVTYCSCVNEHSSAVAALRLTEAGARDVRALVGGYPAWVALGGPVATGDGSGE